MNKLILIAASLCCTAILFSALAADEPSGKNSDSRQNTVQSSISAQAASISIRAPANVATQAQAYASEPITKRVILIQDSGKNISDMNISLFNPVNYYGQAGRSVGEAVKFTAPKPGWKLEALQIVGRSPYNNTTKMLPPDKNFLIEVRDKNTDLLYKFADNQNAYFASLQNQVIISTINIPSIPITGDFYVLFFSRGSMSVGMELGNATSGSYLATNGSMIPAEFRIANTNETVKVNWLIRAIGE